MGPHVRFWGTRHTGPDLTTVCRQGGGKGCCSSASLGQETWWEFGRAKDCYRRKLLLQAVSDLTNVNWGDSSHAPRQQSHRCGLSLEEASVVAHGDMRSIRTLFLFPSILKLLFAPCLPVIICAALMLSNLCHQISPALEQFTHILRTPTVCIT